MASGPRLERGVADRYATSGEVIWEFSAGKRRNRRGGLLSIRSGPDGQVIIELYRMDEGVEVRVSDERLPRS
jgi:hypothetical protein